MIDFLPVILLHGEFSFQLCNLCPDCAEQLPGLGTFTWNLKQKQKLVLKSAKDKPEDAKALRMQNKVHMMPKILLTFFKTRRLVDTLENCQYFSCRLLQHLDNLTNILQKGATI